MNDQSCDTTTSTANLLLFSKLFKIPQSTIFAISRSRDELMNSQGMCCQCQNVMWRGLSHRKQGIYSAKGQYLWGYLTFFSTVTAVGPYCWCHTKGCLQKTSVRHFWNSKKAGKALTAQKWKHKDIEVTDIFFCLQRNTPDLSVCHYHTMFFKQPLLPVTRSRTELACSTHSDE